MSFNPRKRATEFSNNRHFIFLHEALRKYKDGYYQSIDDRLLLEQLSQQLTSDDSRLCKAREVLETLKNHIATETSTKDLTIDPAIINVRNGLLDIKTMKLIEHTHNKAFLYQINASYKQGVDCPIFKKFLNDILVDEYLHPDLELIDVVQEFFGYCYYMSIPFHKALIFHGEGNNGKSKLISILVKLLPRLVSNVHFEIIGKDPFATSDLAGKLLNVSSEISVKAKLNDGEIKGIIAGDPIRGQRKHERAFDFKPFAKHIITTNNLPSTQDKSFGFFRRFEIIPFRQTFLPEKEIEKLRKSDPHKANRYKTEDPFIDGKLLSELDGIFLWAINGLKRLLENKDFTYSKQVEQMREIFKLRSLTVESFAQKYLDSNDVTEKLLLSDAYKEYVRHCQQNSIPPAGKRKFSEGLEILGYIVEQGTENKTFIKGVKFKEDIKFKELSLSY